MARRKSNTQRKANVIPFPQPILPDKYCEGETDPVELLLSGVSEPFLLEVEGAVPETGIAAGDALIVDRALTPRAGDIVAVDYGDGELYLRKFTPQLRLVGKKYQPQSMQVFGVVVRRISTLRSVEKSQKGGTH